MCCECSSPLFYDAQTARVRVRGINYVYGRPAGHARTRTHACAALAGPGRLGVVATWCGVRKR